jgi:hypothetical protein
MGYCKECPSEGLLASNDTTTCLWLTLTFYWTRGNLSLECLLKNRKSASNCCKARWIC